MTDDDMCAKHFARLETADDDNGEWDDAWTEFNESMYERLLEMGREVGSAIPTRIKSLASKGS